MEFTKSMKIAAAGMRVQGMRLKVIAENLANAQSLASKPGGDPYRRKVVTFKNVLDRNLQIELVKVDRIGTDNTPFKKSLNTGHPGADENGYVKLPNVNPLIEMMDMREAQRSYEANLSIIETTRNMLARTIDLLR